ncbi:uncharacterized protein A4U43_C03F16070 [Asparagus officinalis]|uniref:Uncharacterized protein n=1 Tax=Asparagus officinalis TaxID=4686 RepID=A0A5P1FAH2_ASPOF|nr:uncharacterized protein A4U43_C03F16070 [Asparagus officinalis]
MSRGLRIQVKLLHESASHVVTMELKSGKLYRASMIELRTSDLMASMISLGLTSPVTSLVVALRENPKKIGLGRKTSGDLFLKGKDGKVSQLEHVFIRGSKVR